MHGTRFFHLSPFCIAKLLHVASLALIFILFKYVNSTYTRSRVSPSFQQKPISVKIDSSVCILKKKLREHIFFEPYSASIKFPLGFRFKFDRVRLVHTLFKFFIDQRFSFIRIDRNITLFEDLAEVNPVVILWVEKSGTVRNAMRTSHCGRRMARFSRFVRFQSRNSCGAVTWTRESIFDPQKQTALREPCFICTPISPWMSFDNLFAVSAFEDARFASEAFKFD